MNVYGDKHKFSQLSIEEKSHSSYKRRSLYHRYFKYVDEYYLGRTVQHTEKAWRIEVVKKVWQREVTVCLVR